jgi:hypothetical protein
VLTSRQHEIDFKKTIVKIFFLFHLGNGMLIINAIQSTFPLIVEFNECQVLPCGDLTSNFNSKDTPFICVPSWDPQGSLVSVQSGWMWSGTLDIKDTLPPSFMKILRAGLDPKALERFRLPPQKIINSLLTDYSQNYSCFRHTPLLLVKINNVSHLD